MPENWVDVAVVFVLVVYALRGVQRGLLVSLVDLAGFALALALAIRFYPEATRWLEPYVPLPSPLIKPLAFLGIWLGADVALALLARAITKPLSAVTSVSSANTLLGAIPGAAKGAIVAALIVAVALALPMPSAVRDEIAGSALGARLADGGGFLATTFEDVFGGALEGINVATVRPIADERVELRFREANGSIDPDAEAYLLKLLNEERVRAGLAPLNRDPTLTEAARAHARDMLVQGYFAHVDNEGRSPAERALKAGAKFNVLGENLALAPTVELAHRGLMDSPGHRANILGDQYQRVGIGVLDARLHGKMFAQEFAD